MVAVGNNRISTKERIAAAEKSLNTNILGEPVKLKYRPTLIFEGGSLAIERSGYTFNGDGILGFDDNDLMYEHQSDSEAAYRYIRLPKSELVAIRDFLIRELPLVEMACDCGAPTEGKWAGKHSPHCSSLAS